MEPVFALSYTRRSKSLSEGEFKVFHPLVKDYMQVHRITDERQLPSYFVTSHQIKPEMRVRMQAAIQKHIDTAISSTVNLPQDISTEEVEKIYFLAWKLGCKGITIYREGEQGRDPRDEERRQEDRPEDHDRVREAQGAPRQDAKAQAAPGQPVRDREHRRDRRARRRSSSPSESSAATRRRTPRQSGVSSASTSSTEGTSRTS